MKQNPPSCHADADEQDGISLQAPHHGNPSAHCTFSRGSRASSPLYSVSTRETFRKMTVLRVSENYVVPVFNRLLDLTGGGPTLSTGWKPAPRSTKNFIV